MKKFFKISLIASGLLVASSAFSGVGEYTNKQATCYIFKNNNQLSKKLNCTHSGYEGSVMHEETTDVFARSEFTIPKYGKVIAESFLQGENGDNGRLLKSETKLNSKYAIKYYRNKSLKMITESQAENDWENSLKCYKSKSLNFCYINR